ncbi:hypothetical protein pb186bvf_018793 [Paramecium bursaria]
MAKGNEQMTALQKEAKQYMEKHQIEDIIGDLLNTVTQHKFDEPIIYMIKYLCRVYCTPEQLQLHGISIKESVLQKPVLCLPLPDINAFKDRPILRKAMTREIFYKCKNEMTSYGNTFRSMWKLIKEYPNSKVGVFAVDPDSYTTYEQLFDQVIIQLKDQKDQKNANTPYNRDFTYNTQFFDQIKPEECVVTMRRNINHERFNSTLSPKQREALSAQLKQVLQEQQIVKFNIVHHLDKLPEFDLKKVLTNERMIKQPKDKNLHQYQGSRYPDWPYNRIIMYSEDMNNMVWINKEDHLKFKFISPNLNEALKKALAMNQFLEKYNISQSEKYGYHTVKPQYSGLGLSIQLKFRYDIQSINKIKQNSTKIQNKLFSILFREKGDKNEKGDKGERTSIITVAPALQLGKSLAQIMQQLNQDIQNMFNYSQKENIQQIQQEVDYYSQHKDRIDKLQKTQGFYHIKDIAINIKQDGIFPTRKKYIIVRRNFVKGPCNIDLLNGKKYRQINQKELQRLKFINLNQDTFLIDDKYFLSIKLDDDLLWIFPFKGFSLSQKLEEIDIIISEFLQDRQVAERNEYGYLTNSNEYVGSGISLFINFECSDEIDEQIRKKIDIYWKGQKLFKQKSSLWLHNVNDQNYHQLFQLLIEINQIKQLKEDQQRLSCYRDRKTILLIPYPQFINEYSKPYMEYFQQNIQSRFPHCRPYSSDMKVEKITDNQFSKDTLIKCSIFRNLKQINNQEIKTFATNLSLRERKDLEAVFKKKYQKEGVIYMKCHHIEYTFQCPITQFIDKFRKSIDDIHNAFGKEFWKDENFGFLGPLVQESFVDGFQLQIKTNKIYEKLYKEYNYEYNAQEKSILSKRPCAFNIEVEFLAKLVDL